MSYLFTFPKVSLEACKFLVVMKSTPFFSFCHLLLVPFLRRLSLPDLRLRKFPSLFSSCFIALALPFRPIIPFVLNFCVWHNEKVHLHSFSCRYLVVPIFVVKTIFFLFNFPLQLSRHPCPKSLNHRCKGLFLDFTVFHWPVCLCLCQYQAILITIIL